MNLKQTIVLIVFGLALIACEDSEPPGTDVFSIQIGDGLLSEFAEDWVIISDSEGQFLDAQKLSTGIFSLQAATLPADNQINVTFLNKVNPNPSVEFFSATSYVGVPVGASWIMALNPPLQQDTEVGSFNLTLTNLPDIETVNIALSKLSDGRIGLEGGQDGDRADLVVPITENQKDILLSINPLFVNPDNLPQFDAKYFLIEDPMNGSTVELDFLEDLLSYDQQFSLSIPSDITNSLMEIRAFESSNTLGNGYLQAQGVSIINLSTIPVYYNNDFGYYRTNLMLSTENSTTLYRKTGAAATMEDLQGRPEDFQVSSSGFSSYSLSADPAFDMVESGWSKQQLVDGVNNLLSWTVYSSTDEISFPVLNDFGSLADINAILEISDLDNSNTRCTNFLDGRTYEDFLNDRFGGAPIINGIEEVYQLQKFDN